LLFFFVVVAVVFLVCLVIFAVAVIVAVLAEDRHHTLSRIWRPTLGGRFCSSFLQQQGDVFRGPTGAA